MFNFWLNSGVGKENHFRKKTLQDDLAQDSCSGVTGSEKTEFTSMSLFLWLTLFFERSALGQENSLRRSIIVGPDDSLKYVKDADEVSLVQENGVEFADSVTRLDSRDEEASWRTRAQQTCTPSNMSIWEDRNVYTYAEKCRNLQEAMNQGRAPVPKFYSLAASLGSGNAHSSRTT